MFLKTQNRSIFLHSQINFAKNLEAFPIPRKNQESEKRLQPDLISSELLPTSRQAPR